MTETQQKVLAAIDARNEQGCSVTITRLMEMTGKPRTSVRAAVMALLEARHIEQRGVTCNNAATYARLGWQPFWSQQRAS